MAVVDHNQRTLPSHRARQLPPSSERLLLWTRQYAQTTRGKSTWLSMTQPCFPSRPAALSDRDHDHPRWTGHSTSTSSTSSRRWPTPSPAPPPLVTMMLSRSVSAASERWATPWPPTSPNGENSTYTNPCLYLSGTAPRPRPTISQRSSGTSSSPSPTRSSRSPRSAISSSRISPTTMSYGTCTRNSQRLSRCVLRSDKDQEPSLSKCGRVGRQAHQEQDPRRDEYHLPHACWYGPCPCMIAHSLTVLQRNSTPFYPASPLHTSSPRLSSVPHRQQRKLTS